MQVENIQLDDFTKYKFLSGLILSPSGKNTGFVVHRMDLEENKYRSNIYIHSEERDKALKLTSLDEEKSFIWLDDSRILFPGTRDKKDKERKEKGEDLTSYYEIDINGGEANKVFEIPLNVTSMEFIDDENLVLTASYDFNKVNLEGLSPSEKEEARKKIEDEKDYEIFDEIPFWGNGQGYTNKKRNRLYLYNIKTQKLLPITDVFTNVLHFELNQNKSKIVLISNSFIDKMHFKSNIGLYTIKDDNLESLGFEEDFSYSYINFLNDKLIFTGHNSKSYGINENPHFYRMDLDGSNIKQISDWSFDYSICSSVASDCRYASSSSMKVDGDFLYFTTTENHSSYINKIDLNGHIQKITKNPGSIDGFDIVDGEIKFIGFRGLKLQELYGLKDEKEIQLTSFNDWLIEEKKLSRPEALSFETDGVTIHGWLLKPVDYEEGKKYPAILNIHGGPKVVFGESFFHEMQYWANEGYAVFYCNPRGSDGKGNEFADIRGKYGTIDYEDLMNFTDLVLKKYDFIDKDKLGVTGGSYGGFMTNWIIGHTNRFKAAASQRSISNWISFFATSDIGYYFADDQNLASPWSNMDKLWFHSPMKYADKVKTPTLFIHSEEDYRCWLPEGLQMYSSLKYHGVDARLCMFKGENHELSRSGKPKNRIKRLEEITNWFDKYLK